MIKLINRIFARIIENTYLCIEIINQIQLSKPLLLIGKTNIVQIVGTTKRPNMFQNTLPI